MPITIATEEAFATEALVDGWRTLLEDGGEAAELMSATVQRMRQQWLRSAVTIANVLKNGQTVHRASFEDLSHVRENYEELERACLFLRNMDASAEQSDGASEQGDGE